MHRDKEHMVSGKHFSIFCAQSMPGKEATNSNAFFCAATTTLAHSSNFKCWAIHVKEGTLTLSKSILEFSRLSSSYRDSHSPVLQQKKDKQADRLQTKCQI